VKKVQLLITVLFMGGVTACGKAPVLEVDAELAPYVSQFEDESRAAGNAVRVNDLIARFGELDNPKSNGICEIESGETPRIIISRVKWNRMSAQKREGLMFHELGHCVLNREHNPAVTENGVPTSLMNPYSIDSYTYSEYRKYYLQELFTGKSEPIHEDS
jgi:hypothetical protein